MMTTYFCSVLNCGKTFDKAEYLSRHVRRVHDSASCPAVLPCNVSGCGKMFRTLKAVYDHKMSAHGLLGTKQCAVCAKEFHTGSALKSHQRVHRDYKCAVPGCDAPSYQCYSLLRKHVAKCHSAPKKGSDPCPVCGQHFSRQHDLSRHVRLHDSDVTCPAADCSAKMAAHRLEAHVKRYHSDQLCDQRKSRSGRPLKHKCQECHRLFATARLLNAHCARMHASVESAGGEEQLPKMFACSHANCKRRFRTALRLEQHSNLHGGLRPFRCSASGCDKSYATKGSLQRHTKYAHMKTMKDYEAVERLLYASTAP